MFENSNFRGTRCHICTGCGRCAPSYAVGEKSDSGIQIVRKSVLEDGTKPIESARGERLVTADIGTTTIALQLYGSDGKVAADFACVNPQVRFGADVLSRIQAAQDSAAAEAMRREVTEKLEEALGGFQEHLQPGETMHMVLAANTTMVYLLLGYDPAELGRAPFHASRLETVETVIGGVTCDIFPGLSAFVGGDIAAGMYACGMGERQELTLLIDLGTNGEMVLGNSTRRIACAASAGPAFEGGVNRGVWGADMVHLLARLRREGIMDETGLLADEYFDEGVRIGDVCVTQESIRAIQLAKGAIGAGIQILMQEYGIAEEWDRIDRVILAGGFGYYLHPEDAAVIGLLPQELVNRTAAGGNTALAGALRLGRRLIGETLGGQECDFPDIAGLTGASGTEILNLAAHPEFQDIYITHMGF